MAIEAFTFDAYGTLYDVQSLSHITCEEFPEHGELITHIWRLKQLEYTWLRSLMQSYRSFWEVTEESLHYTLDAIGIESSAAQRDRIMDKYLHLDPYHDCLAALDALKGRPRAILSNGNQEILDTLVANTGLSDRLEAVISIESAGVFKPHPRAYELVEPRLGVASANTVFVSSNAFDACAAKHFGFRVAWIERVTRADMAAEVAAAGTVGPSTLFKLQRMQMEAFDLEPDWRLTSLRDLADLQ